MISFKTERIENEWNSGLMNKKLKDIVNMAGLYMKYVNGVGLILTEIFRYQDEQESIYGATTRKRSVHQYWRGVDIRVNNMTDEQANDLLSFLNKVPYGLKHRTATLHDVGFGKHLHCQSK